ncbi:MAG: hypothetical protein R3A48_01550 [Polyangiales bacterium]
MRRSLRPMALLALAVHAGCSIDFDTYLRGGDAGPRPDLVTPPNDTGVVGPNDTGVVAPNDTGVVAPTDLGVVGPTDTGVVVPNDTGVVAPVLCNAPYLVAVAENLDNNTATLLRWSFANDRACAPLPLTIPHPRAVGVAFNDISALNGPQLIVANESSVSVVDAESGAVIRDVPAEGPPRSIFDIVANGSGSFAVAYTATNSSPPGSVGSVRVFDHRSNNLREVQRWQSNMQFGLSVLSMTAFPGNQGQYLQVRPADTGSGSSAFITSPGSTGLHSRTMPGIITNRVNARALHAYRTVDRRGHYAMSFSGNGSTPAMYVATSEVAGSTLGNTFLTTVRCSTPCPAITAGVAFPDEDGVGAGLCELSGTQYAVVRFGGANTDCAMLDTSAQPGRWRINDLAVMPR